MGLWILLLGFFLGGVSGVQAGTIQLDGTSRIPGELVVKLRGSPSGGPETSSVHSLRDGLQRIAGSARILELQPFRTDARFVRVRLENDGDLAGVLSAFSGDPRIEYSEPNYLYRSLEMPPGRPNDRDLDRAWHLINQGQADSAGTVGLAGIDVGVAPLWERGLTGSRKVVVAVIDTGIQWDHPDLSQNLYTNPGESGLLAGNGIDDDGNGLVDDVHGWSFASGSGDSADDQGHGTHCAGIIGARGNNLEGIPGVNWQVSLMPIKFLDAQGGGTLQHAVEAIQYAIRMKADVLSNSWGGGGQSKALADAIRQARDAGILFVAAAGNDGSSNELNPTYPASYPIENIVSVAAINNQGKLAAFSNYGSKSVHVAAPGVKVYSTYIGAAYDSLSGTSMACPQVAGVAALMLAADSGLSHLELKDRLIRTSVPIKGLRGKVLSGGMVSAANAVDNVVPPDQGPAPSDWQDVAYALESPHPYPNRANLEFKVSVPGARMIRVVFDKIDTELNYDLIQVETPAGEVVETLMGERSDVISERVEGDALVVRLRSDLSTRKFGFVVTRVQVVR